MNLEDNLRRHLKYVTTRIFKQFIYAILHIYGYREEGEDKISI